MGETERAERLLDDADDEAGRQTNDYDWVRVLASKLRRWCSQYGRSGGRAGVDGPMPMTLLQRQRRELVVSGTVAIATASAAIADGPLLQKRDQVADGISND
ncbi:hypothetical protein ACLOJK_001054 [Asimina triloba]